MHTRIVLGDDIWFVVDENIDAVVKKFNDKSLVIKTNVIDGYEVSIVKDKVLCFVSVTISDEN
jgi:hypothetical protein